jgi:hypothetical protein
MLEGFQMTSGFRDGRTLFSAGAYLLVFFACWMALARPAFAGWARTFGTTNREEVYDSIQTPDGGYLLVGATKLEAPPSSALVAKLDSLGQVVWSRFYGAQNQVFKSIISLPNGNYLIVGKTEFFGTPDCILVEIDPSGNVVALRTYGGSGSDTCFAVTRTPDGNFILAGRSDSAGVGNFDAWLLKINPSYSVVWSILYGTPPVIGSNGLEELYALVPTGGNGAIAVGKTHSFTANDSADVLALRVDANGAIQWVSAFNGVFGADGWWDAAHDIIFLADGSVMLTGFAYMTSSYDVLLLQLDASSGAPMFNATYGDAGQDKGQSLVETPSGELVIAGTVQGATGIRALFTKLDATRNVVAANTLGPAASAGEFTANILDVASYFVSGYDIGYVTNSDALAVKVNESVAINACADMSAVTLSRGPGVTPRAATVVNTNFGVTPNTYFLNNALLSTSQNTVCSDEAVSGPDINVVPPSHNYGTVIVGQQSDKVFQVSNAGNQTLSIGVVTDPAAPFSKVAEACSNANLAPLATCNITIRYAAVAVGNHASSFQIPSNDPDANPFTVNVSGAGALAVPDITVNPTTWDFGDVNVGQSAQKVIRVSNDGTANLNIGTITPPSVPFGFVSDACSNTSLPPTNFCDITTRFSPTALGPANGNFNIPSDDPDENPFNVSLSGTGVGPDIDPQPPSLDFGIVRLGSSQLQTLTVSNLGNRDLTIGAYALSPPFSILTDNCWARVLTPFSSCSMGVQFIPQVNDEVLVAFQIASDDPDENPLAVPLRGRGIAPPNLISPANDTYASERPTFRMTTNPTGISTLHYRVDISMDNFVTWSTYDQMVNPEYWSKPSYAPAETGEFNVGSSLLPGDYQWRALVHYHNEGAFSDYSAARTFRVPAPPALLSPDPNAQTGSRPTFTMTWNNPGTPTSLHYILEILDSTAQNVLRTYDQRTSSEGWSQPQYAPGDTATFQIRSSEPLAETTYIWRVQAHLDDFSALTPPAQQAFYVGLPNITNIQPTPIVNAAVRTLQIVGDDFDPGATVRFVCTDCADPGLGDIMGTVVQRFGRYYLEVEFDLINEAIVGAYNLVIANPSGDEARLALRIQPFISFPYIEPGGVQGIAIVPETFPHHGTNLTCMMVENSSNTWDTGYILLDFDITSLPESVRFRVGYDDREQSWDRRDATYPNKAIVLVPMYPNFVRCVPIGLGVNPDKVIFPEASLPQGFSPSGSHDFVIFGEGKQITWKGVGSAAKDAVKGMLVDTLIAAACGIAGDLITNDPDYRNLKKAISDTVDGLPQDIAATPEYVMKEVAKKLAEKIPGVSWAIKIGQCMGQILDAFFYAFDSAAKGAADRLRARNQGDTGAAIGDAIEQALRLNNYRYYSSIAANKVIEKLAEPPCSPPPSQTGGGSYRVQGPWDPNDKVTNTTFPCERIDINGFPQCARYFLPMANATDPIEYVIRFENKAEATGPAVNVVITDILDSDLDPSTLSVIVTSHPLAFQNPEINGQTVTFRFNNINLPPNTNPPDGEGSVRFTVRPRAGPPVGTEIRNMASIVFDFNPAIETPDVVYVLGLADLSVSPTSRNFGTVNVAGGTAVQQFTLTNVGGQPLRISSVQITGADAAHFRTQADSCSGQSFGFNGSCTVEGVFAPTTPGAKQAFLSINSDDFDTPTIDVPLTGTGEGPTVTAARGPASLPSTAQKAATNVPVLQVRLTAGPAESVSVEGLTLQAGGDGNDQTDILAVRLFVDSNADGAVGAGDAELWSGQYSGNNGTAAVAIAPRAIPANGSETYLVTYDFAAQIASLQPPVPGRQTIAPLRFVPFTASLSRSSPRPGPRSPVPGPPHASRLPLAVLAALLVPLALRRLTPSGSRLTVILLLGSSLFLLASCGGGGSTPAVIRSYQATLSAILAKGATTNLPATVSGTPVSGSSLTIQK